jgi:DNA-binding SARP family transcriptional activator/predicted ATPase
MALTHSLSKTGIGQGVCYAAAGGPFATRMSIRAADAVDAPSDPVSVDELPASHSAHLRLLGTFSLTAGDGGSIPIASPRAQSLLAYLVLQRGAPSSRAQISFLLWPDSSEAQAHNNLRQLLHQLRRSWADANAFLGARGGVLALEPGLGLTVDVDEYDHAVAAATAADDGSDPAAARIAFERAADLYRGALLPTVEDEWVLPERERLAAQHQRVLDRLVGMLEQHGDYRAAIERGNQRLRLDPLDERVVRWLMRLHALNQDRAGALRVYQACVALLDAELGVEPDPATREAYDRVLGRESWAARMRTPVPGGELGPGIGGLPTDGVPLIGRQEEWAQSMAAWDRMRAGEAHLLVIGGEAGIGKSRLAAELSDWAGRLGIGSARTRAYAAEGRLSFAPIADWLRSPLLASTLPRLDVGSLSEISRLLPELLVQRPDLPRPSARIEDWQRQAFFQALAQAFLAADRPLLLVLDDLQWCDADTLEWLHFMLRFDRRAELFVAATVRPDEVDSRHPLTALVAALRDDRQLTEIALGPLDPTETSMLAAQTAGRPLLPEQARQIHLETEGNPLFVVETVRAWLIEPGSGRGGSATTTGTTRPTADGRRLPPKVQAIIAARLAHLTEPARDLASLAATVGRAFNLEVIRASGGDDEDRIVAGMDELLRRQIVREQGDGAYDFTHDRIREVAYQETTEARRRLLHRRVADALERVHSTALDAVAAQIAAHCAGAGLVDRAAGFYQQAAEVAQRVGANPEAIALLHRGLGLLETLPPSRERDARELGLQTTLGVSLVATEGYGAPAVTAAYVRCRHLCQVLGRPPAPPVLRALAIAALAHERIDECQALGDHMLILAERDDDPVLRVEAHYVIAMALLLNGAVVPARVELEASLAAYDRERSGAHIALYSQDPAVVCLIRLHVALLVLGDPVAAIRRRTESLELAVELRHPFTLAYALTWDAIGGTFRGDAGRARSQAEAAIDLGREHRMPFWLSLGTIVHGWAVAEQGDIEGGIDEIRHGMAAYEATGGRAFISLQLGLLAEQYGRLGKVERGLTHVAEALALVERVNERWYEAELYRRRGDLLALTSSGADAAEAAWRKALAVARYQAARSLELRAATRLAGIALARGRPTEVAALLEPLVAGFDAAVNLPDLARARTLLAESGASPRAGST